LPLVVSEPSIPRLAAIRGGSGSGVRLAPGLAREVLRAVKDGEQNQAGDQGERVAGGRSSRGSGPTYGQMAGSSGLQLGSMAACREVWSAEIAEASDRR